MDEPGPNGEKYLPAAEGYIRFGASGLAGVWAEENTRESLFDAFRRKETFATTGPRIRLRFFAGYGLDDGLDEDPDMVSKAYEAAVPMGADLAASSGAAPGFLVWAVRDPNSAPLQRVQIVKAWIEDGASKEKVFDGACSDGGAVDSATHRCPDNGAGVDVSDCGISPDKGDAELHTVWTDPEFDASQRALYYVRVLENPTCHWSTLGRHPRRELAESVVIASIPRDRSCSGRWWGQSRRLDCSAYGFLVVSVSSEGWHVQREIVPPG